LRYLYLFGPVPSRRLGSSLGIDLVPYKTCTLDCVYCECGETTDLTDIRAEYVPTDEVIRELDDFLSKRPRIDYLTFSGSGEPTLHSGIGKIISFLKKQHPDYKIALLTNGTLFFDPEVRREVMDCDVILPSLDAGTEGVFKKINRPHENITLKKLLKGLIELRREFSGKIWLEVMVIPGLNDSEEELEAIRKHLLDIGANRIQINSLDRPSTEEWVRPTKGAVLERIASILGGEAVGKPSDVVGHDSFSEDALDKIVSTIRRRPCTADDLAKILGIHLNEVNKYLNYLSETGKVHGEKKERGMFFSMARDESS